MGGGKAAIPHIVRRGRNKYTALSIIPNGVSAGEFASCRKKKKTGPVTLGAVLRVVPIKDVKTMLQAFDIVKRAAPETRIKIMGNCAEDPVYYQECVELLAELGTEDVEFLGQVNIKEHLPEVDLLLLSGISEGQPLAILEGMAAEIPFVATNSPRIPLHFQLYLFERIPLAYSNDSSTWSR